MSITLVEIDGSLYVRYPDYDYFKPIMHVLYWPTGLKAYDFRAYDYELPAELADLGGGAYQLPRKTYGGYGPVVRLTNGGQTKAEKIEHIDVPCPKVRKGVQTRWERGHWQKYLKTSGWVAA